MNEPTQLQVDAKMARDLISDKERWTSGYYAKDLKGELVGPCADSAVCWCAVGAVSKVTRPSPDRFRTLLFALAKQLNVRSISDIINVNDNQEDGYERVVHAFSKIAEEGTT